MFVVFYGSFAKIEEISEQNKNIILKNYVRPPDASVAAHIP